MENEEASLEFATMYQVCRSPRLALYLEASMNGVGGFKEVVATLVNLYYLSKYESGAPP